MPRGVHEFPNLGLEVRITGLAVSRWPRSSDRNFEARTHAADVDDNGKIEISDPILKLSVQFLGKDPRTGEDIVIPTPGTKTCGPDPTEDDSSCGSYSACDGDGDGDDA